MPEGDTIHRAARRLRAVLEGAVVCAAASPRGQLPPAALDAVLGAAVTGVEARGKHLFVCWPDVVLHTHLGMTGSWHLYRAASRWAHPRERASVVLDTGEWSAVCFSAPTCEFLAPEAVAQLVDGLGPDLTVPGADLDVSVRRLRSRPRLAIADALLDQRLVTGIGNVYKSEVLHCHGLHPWTPVGAISEDVLRAVVMTAAELLQANTDARSARRVTVRDGARLRPHAPLRVYGRAGRPCPRCGELVRSAVQGPFARRTYWCPGCQTRDGDGTAC